MSGLPPKAGLSLYADLLDPQRKSDSTTISGAPVKYELKQPSSEAATGAHREKAASLQFQPIRRPQVQQKAKSKPASSSISSSHKFSSSTASAPFTSSSPDKQSPGFSATSHQRPPTIQKSNFEDWVGDEDEEIHYQRPRYDRGRKKKNKNKQGTRIWDWDDIYDPSLPNSHADYKGSEEQIREIRDWKARLYFHQLKEVQHSASEQNRGNDQTRSTNPMFAPPPNFNFAPPSFDNDNLQEAPAHNDDDDDDDDDYYPPTANPGISSDEHRTPSISANAQRVLDDATGEDAYSRRMRLSGLVSSEATTPVPTASTKPNASITDQKSSSASTPSAAKAIADIAAKKAEAQAKLAAMKAKLDAVRPPSTSSASPASSLSRQQPPPPPPPPTSSPPPPPPPPPPPSNPTDVSPINMTISRDPVRYSSSNVPSIERSSEERSAATDEAQHTVDAQPPRSTRPGQKGFAERLLMKYGWEKGQGLGAQGEGITSAIVAKAEKRKKRSDTDGGGWAAPKNMGKIVGGKRRKVESAADDNGEHGQMSEVVKLEGMLKGLDVEHEISDNNLLQEIGDEFGQNYGSIERLFIWKSELGGNDEVFVKFTSQLSALRAVNATDGMTFAGNDVVARFFSTDKFEKGEYT